MRKSQKITKRQKNGRGRSEKKFFLKNDWKELEVAKNYILETELRQLYLLVEQFLSFAEFQVERRNVMHIERKESMDASELLKNPELLHKLKSIIKQQFPEGDDEVFEKEFRYNKNLKLTITLANNEVLLFFSKEQKSENIQYIDWFLANPEAPIKGLGEATMRLGFDDKNEKNSSYYAVTKPHAKSFQILIENLGFVSFAGSTEDGEYKHHYARICKLSEDKNLASKNVTAEENADFIENLKKACLQNEKVMTLFFKDKKIRACRIEYQGQNHSDDIREDGTEGWILREIKKTIWRKNNLDSLYTGKS